MHKVCLLGATGSIGQSSLEVIALHPERYRVQALSAWRRMDVLLDLYHRFSPQVLVVANPAQCDELHRAGVRCDILHGEEGLLNIAADASSDIVVAAIVGAAGLLPTLAAVRAGKRVLLANKESLVMAGGLFMQAVQEHGAALLPVDSEHNAIFQCLEKPGAGLAEQGIERLILTASGGPFRGYERERLQNVTPAQAVRHPRWSMGPKISVDSATLMNKGLELIEACYLFGARADQVQIVVHPQSIVHSMVQYRDGSFLAQLGRPDMRTPIAHALAWPERIDAGVEALDLLQMSALEFEAPDEALFPCLRLARQAFAAGGTACAILNAANEVAVAAFLQNETSFTMIPAIIAEALQRLPVHAVHSLADVVEADTQARRLAADHLRALREG